MTFKTAITAGIIMAGTAGAAQTAQAQTITLLDGSTVTVGQGGIVNVAGSVSGTVQQGGVSSAFSCTYDAVSGRVTGSASCGQILGGSLTGGLNVSALERDIVSARVNVASSGQASANFRLLDDLATRRVGVSVITDVQADLQAGASSDATNVFGEPTYGAWSSASGNYIDDERFGLEKDGRNYVFTAGVDHTVQNWMVGIYGGYLDTNVDLVSLGGDLNSDGWLAGTYVTRVLDKVFSITAAGSYADMQTHLARTSAGTQIRAAFDHREWSASLNGNAFWLLAPQFGVTATAGVSYDAWKDARYTDSVGVTYAEAKGHNVWGKASGTATFFTGILRPYANVTYGRLFSDPDFYTDRDRLTVGGGFAVGQGRLTGVFEVNTLLLREDQSDTTVGLHLRLAV